MEEFGSLGDFMMTIFETDNNPNSEVKFEASTNKQM